jgi:PAS domain S-box-containing protein
LSLLGATATLLSATADLVYYLGYVLLLVTLVQWAIAVARREDLHRFNILYVSLAVLSVPMFGDKHHPLTDLVGALALLLIPYFLLRLVDHFRAVPRPLMLATATIAGLGASLPAWRAIDARALAVSEYAYLTCLLIYIGWAFAQSSRSSAGVTARRLVMACAGSSLLALVAALALIAEATVPGDYSTAKLNILLDGLMMTCFFLAFTTPRSLKTRWQRAEHARYLTGAAERSDEDRGTQTAHDLLRATARSVGNALVFVAMRDDPSEAQLLVRATSDHVLLGLGFAPGRGVVSWAIDARAPVSGNVTDCDPDMAGRLDRYGSSVVVAPLSSGANIWGVVVVVQRRGSLFPEDDRLLLGQFARYAATALDHAYLITQQRERDLRRADRRLREVESRMSLMLDSLTDHAIFIIDEAGRVATWPAGATHVFGYTSQGMVDEEAHALFEMTSVEFGVVLKEARLTGHTEREGLCHRKDGSTFIGVTSIRPLQSDEARGFVAVTRDVTERRDLEDRLRQSQKMEAIGQLAGGIAHDFNNQLTAIMGYADFLGDGSADEEDRAKSLEEIQKAAGRAAELTRRLLAFSRRQVLMPSVVNMSGLVRGLLPMLRRVIDEHITISCDVENERLLVHGDRSELEQVVVNVVVNARDAMPIGGRISIRLATVWLDEAAAAREVPPGRYVLLEIVDTGMGMDGATLARIFEPFFTTKPFGMGTGLGLSTAYGIVQQMNGTVRVTSRRHDGTTFRFFFPETRGAEASVVAAAATDLPDGSQTVLLVEDEESVRTFLARALERHGYQVLAADHQAAALARAAAHGSAIDLLITDVVMPGGTGPDLARALARIRPGVPVLYISGYADVVLSQRSLVPIASHFLQKPFSASDLLVCVNQILDAR